MKPERPVDGTHDTIKLVQPAVRDGHQFDLFDERPLTLKACRLYARRAEIIGHPSLKAWASDFEFVHAAAESAPFWEGDLWNYGEARSEWREKLPQALADIGLDVKYKTLRNRGHVARKVKAKARKVAPSFEHAAAVADLSDEEQEELLSEASEKGWTVRETMNEKRHRARPTVISGQAALEGMFRVLYADPPWQYNDSGVITDTDAYGRAERHYPPMSIDELCALPVEAHALPNSVLFLWVTAPMLYYSSDDIAPDPFRLIRAWGFEPKTGAVWDKVLHNFGHYFSARHEHLLLATRGSCLPDRTTPMIDSVQTIRRGDVHSQKPEEWRRIIERMYDGPYLELFAREKVEGWTSFGNDARLWAEDSRASA